MTARLSPAIALLQPPCAAPPQSEVHALADAYERWLVPQQLGQQILDDQAGCDDRPLLRKAFAVSRDAELMLRELRTKLSLARSRNASELGRKARLLACDTGCWIMSFEDPLLRSICRDAIDLAGLLPFSTPLPIPEAAFRRFMHFDFEAPPLPWEDRS